MANATMLKARESTENILSARRVRDVSESIHYFDPSAAPLALLTAKNMGSRTITNPKFEWIEKDRAGKLTQKAGSATSASTSVAVATGAGNIFFDFDLVLNLRTGEVFRVNLNGVSTDTLTVTRAVGSTAAAAMNDLDDLYIIGNANAEGGTLGVERSVQEVFPFNYSQIFRQPFGSTGTQMATTQYTGKEKPYLVKDNAVEHTLDIERSFLFGERNIDTSSTKNPIRYSGGARYWVTTNVTDAASALTEATLEKFCESIFAPTGGGATRVLLVADRVATVINQLAVGRLETVPKDEMYGIATKEFQSVHGTLLIAKHRLLKNGPGGTGYGSWALAVDPQNIRRATLEGRDTMHREDVGTPGDDGWTDEFLTETGVELTLQTVHGWLKNASS